MTRRGHGVLRPDVATRPKCAAWGSGSMPAGFVAPFHHDGHGFIWDAAGSMAADTDEDGNVRARGWGRVQYLPDGEAQMDAWTAWVDGVAGDCATLDAAARRMNAAYREKR